MKLTEEQRQGIKDFVNMVKNEHGEQIKAVVTIHENEGCGLYIRKGKEYLDIPCLAVACLENETWIGLGYELNLMMFDRTQVL